MKTYKVEVRSNEMPEVFEDRFVECDHIWIDEHKGLTMRRAAKSEDEYSEIVCYIAHGFYKSVAEIAL